MTERHRLGLVNDQEPFVGPDTDEYGLRVMQRRDFRVRPPAMTEAEFRLSVDRRLRAIEIILARLA